MGQLTVSEIAIGKSKGAHRHSLGIDLVSVERNETIAGEGLLHSLLYSS